MATAYQNSDQASKGLTAAFGPTNDAQKTAIPNAAALVPGAAPAAAPTAPVVSPIQRTIDPTASAAESYLNTFTPPQSADQISESMRQSSQGTIDSLNKVYDDQVAAAKQTGQQKLDMNNAVSVLSGLTGSTEATRTRGAVLDANDKQTQAINNERLAKLQDVYSKISSDARAEALKQKEDATKSAGDILTRKSQVQTEALNNIKTMAGGGLVDFESFKNSPQNQDVYQHALEAAGGSEDNLRAIFAMNRPKDQLVGTPQRVGDHFVQAYHNPITGKVSYDTINVPGGLPPEYTSFQKIGDSKSGEFLYAIPQNWDGDQSKLKLIASTQGAAGTGPGGLTPEALDQQAQNYLMTGKLSALGNGGAATKVAILNRAAELATGPGGVPAAAAKYAAAAGAVKTRTESLTKMLSASSNLEAQFARLKQLSDSVNGTGLSGVLGAVGGSTGRGFSAGLQSQFGSDDAAAYRELINTIRQDYSSMQAAVAGSKGAEFFSKTAEHAIPDGLTSSQYDKIYQTLKTSSDNAQTAIQGEIDKVLNSATTPASNSGPANTTLMIGPDGQQYHVPNENVDKFKAAGGRQAFNSVGGDTNLASSRATRNNNPLNMKASSFTSSFPGVVGTDPNPASDGGKFLTFASPQAGFDAAKKLITAPSYANLTVDAALKRWSNKGYGGELAPSIANKKINSLTPAELQTLVQKMAHREGYTA